MMQLIHDIAPGAKQVFHAGLEGQANLARGILRLAAAPVNADVIVDDIIFFAEPFFQDGDLAQVVDRVVANGVAYFSAAGNSGRLSYASGFRNSGVPGLQGRPLHDFNPAPGVDAFQSVTIRARSDVIVVLQWDQPFFSVSGSPGARSDLDIALVDSSRTIVAGAGNNNIGRDPVEVFGFANTSALPKTLNMAIQLFSGPAPARMKYVVLGRGFIINQYATNSGTLFGHANAARAEAVGAAHYMRTPECGTSPPQIEEFSSAGGIPILFNASGARFATPVIRQKPDIVAPNGTNTTFFPPGGATADPAGPCSSTEPFPNFVGTSAAAPHAAAVAALMLDATPALTPAAIYSRLESTAINMGPLGFDFDTGFGLIQADRVVGASSNAGTLRFSASTYNASESGGSATISIARTGGSSGPVSIGFSTVNGTAIVGADYTFTSGVRTWAAGDTANKTFTVPIINDADAEGNETVTLSLRNPDGGAVLGIPRTAVLTIVANDQPAQTCGGLTATIVGTPGNEGLLGTPGPDVIDGLGGADIITGLGGNDVICGGLGNDIVQGGPDNDRVFGEEGNDTVRGGNGSDQVNGDAGADQLFGDELNDTLNGGPGTDRCDGRTGTDAAIGCETIVNIP
jgi:hypothetical protein